MGIALLAPVPAIFLRSAIVTCLAQGRVAFGTNAISPFDRIEDDFGVGVPVIIVPTIRYGDPDGFGRLTFGARYVGYVPADRRTGLHPTPAVRPDRVFDSADPDSAAIGYWEIADLEPHAVRIDLTSLTALGRTTRLPGDYRPHGPLLVKAPFLD